MQNQASSLPTKTRLSTTRTTLWATKEPPRRITWSQLKWKMLRWKIWMILSCCKKSCTRCFLVPQCLLWPIHPVEMSTEQPSAYHLMIYRYAINVSFWNINIAKNLKISHDINNEVCTVNCLQFASKIKINWLLLFVDIHLAWIGIFFATFMHLMHST